MDHLVGSVSLLLVELMKNFSGAVKSELKNSCFVAIWTNSLLLHCFTSSVWVNQIVPQGASAHP
jgi:hypothetical protein